MITEAKTKMKAIRELKRFYEIYDATPNSESLKVVVERLKDIHSDVRLFPGLSVIQGRINTANELFKSAGNRA
jgi:hypothetical protein